MERRPQVWAHADALAEAVDLDMRAYWQADERSYFGRVTKAQIGEAVREAVSARAAERIAGMKKPDMATEAALLLDGKGGLPSVLRRAGEVLEPVKTEDAESAVMVGATV